MSENGKPTTCSVFEKGLFEYSKARNIVDHLPKTLKKLGFKTEAVPDINPHSKPVNKKELKNTEYKVPESVSRWIEKIWSLR